MRLDDRATADPNVAMGAWPSLPPRRPAKTDARDDQVRRERIDALAPPRHASTRSSGGSDGTRRFLLERDRSAHQLPAQPRLGGRAARRRRADPGRGRRPLTGSGLADDPVHFTGGGRTEIELDLLFDTSLGGSTVVSQDVKDLTRPLWELSENYAGADGGGQAARACASCGERRGTSQAFVTAVAERFERFDPFGGPAAFLAADAAPSSGRPIAHLAGGPACGSRVRAPAARARSRRTQLIVPRGGRRRARG